MLTKRYKPEQIVTFLRQIEVEIAKVHFNTQRARTRSSSLRQAKDAVFVQLVKESAQMR